MSRINPSIDPIESASTAPIDYAGVPSGKNDKYDNSSHLKYGQTENQEKTTGSHDKNYKKHPEEKIEGEDKNVYRSTIVRRLSASGDSAAHPHTFYEEFLSGLTGDDFIKQEEKREHERKKLEEQKRNNTF
ncbi:10758_t:CDS:2 [Entrophospora sp. SA101]|nr:6998_t:CDS:2 [Entrophospora sp. SA101]CAJ0643267.1 3028_t:CDS:2 [Entrophospora sp. SA101]CAJ0749411.1 10758_t:CDS:2 [Entrophospora sp. SA101]CAJ0835663.1 13965_t:CDS:2 [Entrophospora sp. SA101]CAJ0838271.1 17556_t:CDS:2 [Entrophospora sp. SA101]